MDENLHYRQHSNLQIIEVLRRIAERHPALRFGQILMITELLQSNNVEDEKGNINVEIVDPFNEESEQALKRMLAKLTSEDSVI